MTSTKITRGLLAAAVVLVLVGPGLADAWELVWSSSAEYATALREPCCFLSPVRSESTASGRSTLDEASRWMDED